LFKIIIYFISSAKRAFRFRKMSLVNYSGVFIAIMASISAIGCALESWLNTLFQILIWQNLISSGALNQSMAFAQVFAFIVSWNSFSY